MASTSKRWTTAPVGALAKHRSSWWRRFRDRTAGFNVPSEENIRPGYHDFNPMYENRRRTAELFHDRALELGFESELFYLDRGMGWQVTVRHRGDQDIRFTSDFP